ncbi:hypothetical protein C8R45DRAFT_961508 [Mycena sanguinolenta]|nr:hypothetical protein C8R45DRAFT_961508 [Mycena sanguinolenta]
MFVASSIHSCLLPFFLIVRSALICRRAVTDSVSHSIHEVFRFIIRDFIPLATRSWVPNIHSLDNDMYEGIVRE